MKKHRFYIISALLLLLLAGTISFIVLSPQKNDTNGRRLVALVNGEPVYLDDSDRITKMIDVINLHQFSEKELKEAVHKYEINNISSLIRQTIIHQKINEYHITVSEEEIQKEIDAIYSKIDSNTANDIIHQSNAIYEALKEWQTNPSESERIFNELHVSIGYTENQWELLQATYNTPEDLRKMYVPKNLEELRNGNYGSAKNDLLFLKLVDTVTDITITEKEIKEAYELQYGDWDHDLGYEEAREQIKQQLLKENQWAYFEIWFNEQYKNSNIKITDRKYKEVLDRIR